MLTLRLRLEALAMCFALLFITSACTDAPRRTNGTAEIRESAVARLVLLAEHVLIGEPDGLLARDTLLWVSDRQGEPFLHLLHSRTGVLLRAVGRRGAGPGDFSWPVALVGASQDGLEVTVFDATASRLTTLRLHPDSGVVPQVTQLPVSPRVFQLTALGSRNYLGWAAGATASVRLLNDSMALVREVSATLLGNDSVAARSRVASSAAHRTCAHPAGRTFATAYAWVDRLEFRDDSLRLLGVVGQRHRDSTGRVRRTPRGAWTISSDTAHYIGCAATQAVFLALYRGRPEAPIEGSPDSAADSTELRVYSWEGRLLTTYSIPEDVNSIATDSQSTSIYVSSARIGKIWRLEGVALPAFSPVSSR